jgi:hypothetical protein
MSKDDPLIGAKVKDIRSMTNLELQTEGWEAPYREGVTCVELEDGTILYPSTDGEGNGPGKLFGTTIEGQAFVLLERQDK